MCTPDRDARTDWQQARIQELGHLLRPRLVHCHCTRDLRQQLLQPVPEELEEPRRKPQMDDVRGQRYPHRRKRDQCSLW